MISAKSDSDVASSAPSSPPRSPKRPVYFVQSPSRESHDGDKSSSLQPSPMESPSHPSYGRHSRNSSASRFSGIFRSSSGRKSSRKRNEKGWPECHAIMEEGAYDELDRDTSARKCPALLALVCFVFVGSFSLFCLIMWGVSRTQRLQVTVQSLTVTNLYVGEGSDFSGVPTRMITVNGSFTMSIYNPARLFGMHISSSSTNLIFSEIRIATGSLKKYYQPRNSRRKVAVVLEGNTVPLYGAGSNLASKKMGEVVVPLTLQFAIHSRENVVGKLVRIKHTKQISCPLVLDSSSFKPVEFMPGICSYY